jgi:hypothetical protein
MLREAKIIVPEFDNDKNSLSAVHRGVAKHLQQAFGGVTITKGDGSWFDPSDGEIYSEPVLLFYVACEVEQSSFDILSEAAAYVKKVGKQKAVYVNFPDGSVKIV